MAVSPDGKRLYVTNLGDRTVSVIDTTANQVTATIPCRAAGLYGAAVSLDGKDLYLSDVSSLLVIDTATHQLTGGVGVEGDPSQLVFSPDGSHLYVAVAGRKAAAVVDTATNDVTATIKVGDHPYYLALSPDGSRLYVANSGSDTLSVINTATHHVTATIATGNPFGVAVSPDGAHVYVANDGHNTLSVIKAANNSVIATVAVSGDAIAPVVSPNGAHVYVVSGDAPATVTIIDAATNAIAATTAAGEYPTAIAISRDGSTLYVTNNSANTVTVIAVAAPPVGRPDWSETLVAQILVGVINDAGGWVNLGGKIIRVPPRQPVEAILAALPSQLAKRLTPLLKSRPQGAKPEVVLRQELSKAVAEYQKESRG